MIRSILLAITFFFVHYAQGMDKFETENFSVSFTLQDNNQNDSFIDIRCLKCKKSLLRYDEEAITNLIDTVKNDPEWKNFLQELITTIKGNFYIQNILDNLEWNYGFRIKANTSFRAEDFNFVEEMINILIANCYFCNESNEPQYHSFCLHQSDRCINCHQKTDQSFLQLLRPPGNFGKKSLKKQMPKNQYILKNKTIKEFNAPLVSAEKIAPVCMLFLIYLCCTAVSVMLIGDSTDNSATLVCLASLKGIIIFLYFMMFAIGITGNDKIPNIIERALATAKDLNIPFKLYLARLRNNHRLNFYDMQTESFQENDDAIMIIEYE